ncbi:hypothetical protein [Halorussus sp. MSC15.2]|uniref:hypothetical protein n=1 Tax=Halorussus sp. MSC15.2 TaxID=2283638 RepID=UPI0013D6E87E|nr:hypothetical protein [Halorussus sp. MSC15.2]NEU56065.1 hypothetical protein [Halorussus sp. MSC15.2]
MGTDDLDELENSLDGLDGGRSEENKITADDVFPAAFMEEYTNYGSLQAFFDDSEWDIESEDDLDAVPTDEFDEHVANNTDFGDWEEMKSRAGAEWMGRQLQGN